MIKKLLSIFILLLFQSTNEEARTQSFTDIKQIWLDKGSSRIRIQPEDFFSEGRNKYLVSTGGVLSEGDRLMLNDEAVHTFSANEIKSGDNEKVKMILEFDENNNYLNHKIFFISDTIYISKIKYANNKYFVSAIGQNFESSIHLFDEQGEFLKTLVHFDGINRAVLSDFDVNDEQLAFSGTFDKRPYIIFNGDTIKQKFQNFETSPIPWFTVGFVIDIDLETSTTNFISSFGCSFGSNSIGRIKFDQSENLIIYGNYNGENFNFMDDTLPYRGGLGKEDAYLAKIDHSGKLSWVRSFSSNSKVDKIQGLVLDEKDAVYISYVNELADLYLGDTVISSKVNFVSNYYFIKFNSVGILQWINEFKSDAGSYQIPLFIENNNIFFGGNLVSKNIQCTINGKAIDHSLTSVQSVIYSFEKNSGDITSSRFNITNEKRIDLIGCLENTNYNACIFYNFGKDVNMDGTTIKKIDGLDFVYILANARLATNISEELITPKLSIFPTLLHSYDQLFIRTMEDNYSKCQIVDVTGKILSNCQFDTESSITLPLLENGLFYLQISTLNKNFSTPFIIQN